MRSLCSSSTYCLGGHLHEILALAPSEPVIPLPVLQILLVAAVVDFVIALGSGEEGLRYVVLLLLSATRLLPGLDCKRTA